LIHAFSVLLVTKGEIVALAGVYTFSFSGNGLFGIENLLLNKRKNYQDQRVRGISVVVAVALIVTAFIGNMELNIDSFYTFLQYLVPAFAFVAIMLNRSLIRL
jgi:hypothetical protein